MLQKIILRCKYDGQERASYNWGSLFHGVIINSMPPDIAETMHENDLRPFSQYITSPADGELEWSIGMWDNFFADYIVAALIPLTTIELKQKNLTLNVTNIQREIQSEKEFFSCYFTTDTPGRRFEINFLTPCAHKREGSYTLFPSPDLMINNLSKRCSAFMEDVYLDDPGAMAQVYNNIKIVRYSLRSAVFYLEKTKITGYVGKTTLVINGSEQIARLGGALLSFAEYSGLGIKTALGMGGVKVTQIP